jgi:hypothetical protein
MFKIYKYFNTKKFLSGGGKILEKICSICSKKFHLYENLSGLVFKDELFICEDCNDKHSSEELKRLTKTIMQDPFKGMPIGLWLIHEQNKDKTIMTVKRQ